MSTDRQHDVAKGHTEMIERIKSRSDGQNIDDDIAAVVVEETRDAHGGGDRAKPEKTYVIQVNTQNVTMQQHKATGLEIKTAAIAQGVAIESDFVLSVKHGDRYNIVGDDDDVTLRDGLDFIVTAADDNS